MSFFDHVYRQFVDKMYESLFKTANSYFSSLPVHKRHTYVIRGLLEVLYSVYQNVEDGYKIQIKNDIKALLEQIQENENSGDVQGEQFTAPKTTDKN